MWEGPLQWRTDELLAPLIYESRRQFWIAMTALVRQREAECRHRFGYWFWSIEGDGPFRQCEKCGKIAGETNYAAS